MSEEVYVTPEEASKYLPISATTLKNWARDGYPLRIGSKEIRIKLDGAIPCGAKKWGFNVRAVLNFLERVNDEKWVSLNVDTRQKTAQRKNQNTTRMNSSSRASDFKVQLTTCLLSQRRVKS